MNNKGKDDLTDVYIKAQTALATICDELCKLKNKEGLVKMEEIRDYLYTKLDDLWEDD